MDDLDVRELRYFVAVAEELSFSGAARRLGITQPSLSRAIGRLEAKLGTRLFERTTRRVTLTRPAAVLLGHATAALAALDAAARLTRRAGTGDPQLAVTASLGLDVRVLGAAIEEYHRSNPGLPRARTAVRGWQRADSMIREGTADAALLRTPFDPSGLDTEILGSEPRVALLARDHRLAGQPRLRVADLAAEHAPGSSAPDAATAPPPASDLAQLLEEVALGQSVAFVPASLAGRLTCPDIVSRSVAGLDPSILAVAWLATSRSLAVARFVEAARTAARSRCQQTGTPAPADYPGAIATVATTHADREISSGAIYSEKSSPKPPPETGKAGIVAAIA